MIDNSFNQKQYSDNAKQYLESNPEGAIGGGTPSQRASLIGKYLPKGRRIFEVGSGGGIDALTLKEAGYEVIASDFVEEFVTELKQKGLNTVYFDAKKDEFPEVDAVYANAVFVHFTPEEVQNCLARMKEKLENEKIIFISVLKGEGSERSARGRGFERDFHYYTLDKLTQLLQESRFKVVFSDDSDPKWLQVIGQSNDL